jgi:thioredoxin-like negative regulator of GroEL
VTGLTLTVAIQMALLGAPPSTDTSYATAHEMTSKTGRPMVILVGAKWCPACVQMKDNVVPQLKKRGSLTQVSYAEVDLDRERELGQQLTKGGPIPQLLMYRKTELGWRLRRIVGGQNVENVGRFIAQGIALDRASKTHEVSSNPANKSLQMASHPEIGRGS